MKKTVGPNTVFPIIDFHSHILPRMDDGSESSLESEQMLLQSAEQGVRALVLTPHFYPSSESPEHFIHRRQDSYEHMLRIYQPELHPTLYLGAEVAYFSGIGRCEKMRDLTISGTTLILIEMPFSKWNQKAVEDLLLLKQQLSLTPVIAHVERCMKGNLHYLETLSEHGILIQSNADFFVGRTAGKACKLLRKGGIQLLGSDAHNLDKRKPNLGAATRTIATKLSDKVVFEMYNFSKTVLEGTSENLSN